MVEYVGGVLGGDSPSEELEITRVIEALRGRNAASPIIIDGDDGDARLPSCDSYGHGVGAGVGGIADSLVAGDIGGTISSAIAKAPLRSLSGGSISNATE